MSSWAQLFGAAGALLVLVALVWLRVRARGLRHYRLDLHLHLIEPADGLHVYLLEPAEQPQPPRSPESDETDRPDTQVRAADQEETPMIGDDDPEDGWDAHDPPAQLLHLLVRWVRSLELAVAAGDIGARTVVRYGEARASITELRHRHAAPTTLAELEIRLDDLAPLL